jgi:hypothetical protein
MKVHRRKAIKLPHRRSGAIFENPRAMESGRLRKELRRLDGYVVVILDDIGYLQQNRDEGRRCYLPSSRNAMSARAY